MEFILKFSPCENDEHIKTVPGICQVCTFSDQSHRGYLDTHFNGEEGKDAVVEYFKYFASCSRARNVVARLIHAQRDTIQQYHSHAYSLKPCANKLCQGIKQKFAKQRIINYYY